MSEIRCPMCGKPNPEDLENCQHCQARLKPLVFSDEDNTGDSVLPDWLRADPEGQESPPPAEDSDPEDWLSRLRPEADTDNETEAPAPFDADGDDDWLGRMRSLDNGTDEQPKSEAPAEEDSIFDGKLPEWMSAGTEYTPEAPPASTEAAPESAPEAARDTDEPAPDWLSELSDDTPAESPASTASAPEEELPDWMLNLDDEDEAEPEAFETAPAPEQPATTPEAESELPDWLASASAAEEPTSPKPDESEELPDWMLSAAEESEPAETTPPFEEADLPAETGDLPDWMAAEFTAEQTAAEDDGIPDWMSGEEDADHTAELPTIRPDTSPLEPDWPTSFDAETAELPDGLDADLTPSDDLEPDWLDSLGGEDAPELFDLPDEAEDEALLPLDALTDAFGDEDEAASTDDDAAPADLPDWLQAMRPVESAADEGQPDAGPVEQTGPLAGLSGVLMAEPEIARLKKAPTFTSKLEVTPAQQEHVQIFRELLENEGQPKFVRQPLQISSQNLLRWVSAILLILVVGFGVVSQSQFVPAPTGGTLLAGMLKISNLIETLAPTDPVLIAFDYEPGTSGEMNAAAAGVIDHLMLKGAYLSLVSTSPTGPALAENFIHTTMQAHSYTSGVQYTNLGYLPGGASGLLGFVQMPRRLTPLTFDGMEAWLTPALQNIQTLSDYKLVVLITDNPDIARIWIEQVQPALENTPMIAITSAQVEPILQPYASGGNAQLSGVVSGINGGAIYENVTGKPNLARTYWDTLNYALMAAVIVLLIGSTVNMLARLIQKDPTGGKTA